MFSRDRSPRAGKAESPQVLLTVIETAKMVRVSKSTLYNLFIHTKRLETIQVGRRRLVPVDAVHSLLAELRAEGAS